MGATLKPGTRLFSAVCDAEFIVIKGPAGDAEVTIGGVPALASAAERNGSVAVVEGHGGERLVFQHHYAQSRRCFCRFCAGLAVHFALGTGAGTGHTDAPRTGAVLFCLSHNSS